jgi:osmotically-inducible protein OsmY
MSERERYRASMAQRGPNSGSESQWQRDYGQRNQRFEETRRSQPRNPDYSRDQGIERELRDNEYPRDDGYAQDDRFLLDFGPTEERQLRAQERYYPSSSNQGDGSSNDTYRRHFQPTARPQLEHFGSRARAEVSRPSGLQAASFYGRGPKGYARSDERIREDVCQRLSDNDEVDASEIEVFVRDREVTLEGSVETRRMKHLSEDLADSVSGVEDVHNRLTVRKAFLKDVADRVLGKESEEHHAHSGTKNTAMRPSGETAAPSSATRMANGHT